MHRLLTRGQAPQADITVFLCAQLAFWLLAATDGHAKNFSIFLLPGAMCALVDRVDAAIAAVEAKLPSDFPARTAQAIFDGLRGQAEAWRAEPADGRL